MIFEILVRRSFLTDSSAPTGRDIVRLVVTNVVCRISVRFSRCHFRKLLATLAIVLSLRRHVTGLICKPRFSTFSCSARIAKAFILPRPER